MNYFIYFTSLLLLSLLLLILLSATLRNSETLNGLLKLAPLKSAELLRLLLSHFLSIIRKRASFLVTKTTSANNFQR